MDSPSTSDWIGPRATDEVGDGEGTEWLRGERGRRVVAVVRRPTEGLGIAGIEPDLERTCSLGHAFIVRNTAPGTDDLDVTAAERHPRRASGVEVGVLAIQDERHDLEAFVPVEAELEVIGEVAVGPVEESCRGPAIGALAADHGLVGLEHTAHGIDLESGRPDEGGSPTHFLLSYLP